MTYSSQEGYPQSIKQRLRTWLVQHRTLSQIILCSLIVLIIGTYSFVFSDSNIKRHYQYSQQIHSLTREYNKIRKTYYEDSIKLASYGQDLTTLERMAREEYHMQRPEEVIFLIQDSPSQ